jgi:ubiquinone/menaquinone biosynthesis C-methylase UbiE
MELREYSEKFIHYYSEELSPVLLGLILELKNIKTLADCGCGDGAILYALNKRRMLDSLEKIVAIDLSKERIDNVSKVNPKISAIVADVCDLHALNDGEVDLIISNQIIEHVSDDDSCAKEMARILSRDGRIYLSTVFKKSYGWYFYKNKDYVWVIDPTHVREYTSDDQLFKVLKKYNLKIVSQKKTLHWFAVTDFILKRIGLSRYVYEHSLYLKFLRKVKVPIPGYYNWELVCKKS